MAAVISFANLGLVRNRTEAANREVHVRYDALAHQNRLLKSGLEGAQRGENVVLDAYRYFGLRWPGVTTVDILSSDIGENAVQRGTQRSQPPYWSDWWQRLLQP